MSPDSTTAVLGAEEASLATPEAEARDANTPDASAITMPPVSRLLALDSDGPASRWRVLSESRWEAMAGVISLEEIQTARLAILPRYRALKARYDDKSQWDAMRKAYRSAILLQLRAGPPPAGAKAWTDVLMEAAAAADDRYLTWLDRAEIERAELYTLDVAMRHLEEAYNRGQAEMRLATSEAQHGGRATP